MELKRVVVTGLGCVTPLGNNVQDFWENLSNGVSGADLITRFDASKFKTQFACEVKNFKPEEFFGKKEVRKIDLFTQFALFAAEQAINDSGIQTGDFNRDKVGVIWGSGIGGVETFFCRSKGFCLRRWYSTIQSLFHPQNDCRHCLGSNLN